ncbi:hypothetical protein MPTK1_5g04310 [Marchantia polymorpha subsp. ruderalis]|nr:hypothetical protein Mp_5g04310 [Marchantia polymorpha subsp. ruderalis]
MNSVCFEANARERDPVNGVYGTLRDLQREVERLEENRTAWAEKLRLLLLEDAAANNVNNAPHTHTAYNAVPPDYNAHARPTQVAFTETTPALQQQQLHYIQMPQQQMGSLEYFVRVFC